MNIMVRRKKHFMEYKTILNLKCLKIKKIYKLATERTRQLLEDVSSKSGYFRLKSHGVGKYGRVLGELFVMDVEGKQWNINETLISEGHAYVYDGGKKKVFKNE